MLILEVKRAFQSPVGGLGKARFKRGLYLYAGSALGQGSSSLEGRLKRHLRGYKKVYWHIDHLTTMPQVKVVSAYYVESEVNRECELTATLVKALDGKIEHPGFGSTDCGCEGHLIYVGGRSAFDRILENASVLKSHGLKPYVMT